VRAKPYVFTNFSPRAVVQRDGRFLKRERFTQRYAHGDVGRFKTSFGGRFRADGASGTLRARLVLFNRRGRRVGRCDTGTRRWSALAV
jgi:hypothetical protein